ncbi:MAG: molybdenum cofactor biosynthesis protein MoaE [Deltaproteobacteria bacterium]|nr:molybdenum cofactor biosynthesis protein MoaE [Deltaproteobacteria bacterium]
MEKDIIKKIRNHPDINKVGMIASHLGIVRGHSRDGKKVKAVEVIYDMDSLDDIIKDIKKLPGIVEALVEVKSGVLNVGDEVMYLAVGGDIRENVFPALIKGVDMIKKRAVKKKEVYEE